MGEIEFRSFGMKLAVLIGGHLPIGPFHQSDEQSSGDTEHLVLGESVEIGLALPFVRQERICPAIRLLVFKRGAVRDETVNHSMSNVS